MNNKKKGLIMISVLVLMLTFGGSNVFAATGDPNGEGLPAWEMSTDGTQLMELGENVGMTEDRFLAIDRILDRMQDFS